MSCYSTRRSFEPKRPGGMLPSATAPEESLLQRDSYTGRRLFLQTVQREMHGLRSRLSCCSTWMPARLPCAFQSSYRCARWEHGIWNHGIIRQVNDLCFNFDSGYCQIFEFELIVFLNFLSKNELIISL